MIKFFIRPISELEKELPFMVSALGHENIEEVRNIANTECILEFAESNLPIGVDFEDGFTAEEIRVEVDSIYWKDEIEEGGEI